MIIFSASLVYSLATGFERIDFKVILILGCISLTAELLEFYLGVKGARKFDLSKKGMTAFLLGAVPGALLLTPFLMGFGTLAGGFLGGFSGILAVELARRRKLKPSMRMPLGCLYGRIGGTLAKGCCAMTMVIIVLSAVYS